MKIAIQNNTVVGIYQDSQQIQGLCRFVPDGFRYAVPITDQTIDGPVQRYSIAVGDPDPVLNAVNIPDLATRKTWLETQASNECTRQIEYKGENTRYQTIKQNSFSDIDRICKDWLAANPSASPEEKAPYEERIAKIHQVRVWITSILSYYYTIEQAIAQADEAGMAGITWDYGQFEATDPGITLGELMF
jgi:hypothetical protein